MDEKQHRQLFLCVLLACEGNFHFLCQKYMPDKKRENVSDKATKMVCLYH